MADPIATQVPAAPAYFVDPMGEVVQLPFDQATRAFELGYQPADPTQIAKFQQVEKFGGTGGEILAGLAGAGRGATFGLSDVALTGTGLVNPETLQGLREVNPAASMVGELGGVAATAFLPGSPVKLLGKAGKAIATGVEGALPAGGGLAAAIARRAAAQGAGSAVEGMVYGAGQMVTEADIGPAPLTAEKVLAHVGLSGAVGGVLGGVLGAGEIAIPKAIQATRDALAGGAKKAKESFEGMFAKAEGLHPQTGKETTELLLEFKQELSAMEQTVPGITEALAGSKRMAGSTPEMVQWALKNKDALAAASAGLGPDFPRRLIFTRNPATAQKLLDNWEKIIVDPTVREGLSRELAESGQQVLDSMKKLSRTAYEEIFPAEAAKLVEGVAPEAAVGAFEKGVGVLEGVLGEMHELSDTGKLLVKAHFDAGRANNASKILGRIREQVQAAGKAPETAGEALNSLLWLRRQLDDASVIPRGSLELKPIGDQNVINAMKGVRAEVNRILRDETVWGEAAVRRVALDEAYHDFIKVVGKDGPFRKLFLEKVKGEGFGDTWRINTVKLDTWMNQMGSGKADPKAAAWGDMMDAVKRFTDEVERSAGNAGASFDRGAVDSVMARAKGATSGATEAGGITRTFNMTSPTKMPWGSNSAAPAAAEAEMAAGVGQQAASFLLPGFVNSAIKATVTTARDLKAVDRTVIKLAALERIGMKVSKAIDVAADKLVKWTGRVITGTSAVRGELAADTVAVFEKRVALIQSITGDPEKMHRVLTAQGEHMDDAAPNTSQEMQIATARAAGFLDSKIPRPPSRGALSAKWQPSPAEAARFDRYWQAVNEPQTVLDHAAKGTLMPEHVEALTAVYPQLLSQMRGTIVDKAASAEAIPYRSRMMMSMFLGQDLDGSTSPASVMANQASHQSPSSRPSEQMPPAPMPQRTPKITLSSRMLTPSQASASRR